MNEYLRVFRALSDENRIKILEKLSEGEQCACCLLEGLGISQSTLSHHMKILCASGIVVSRQEGKWTRYRLSASGGERAINLLKRLITPDAEQEDG